MTEVFISYAHTDDEFVKQQLFEGLKAHFLNAADSISTTGDAALKQLAANTPSEHIWVDWEDIPPTSVWLEEICAGIREADNFIFVISPHSLASEVCNREIEEAITQNKTHHPHHLARYSKTCRTD